MNRFFAKHVFAFVCVSIIVATTAWTFLPVHSFGYVDYDDPAYITGNPYVSSGLDAQNIRWAFAFVETKGSPLHQGVRNLYHPVTWISHMLDVELFGIDSPGAQHVMNLGIHLLAGILLFFIFLKLLDHHLVALVTALLFCIHPLHVESVAWLSERKDTLSALFAFASILLYQFYADHKKSYAKWISVFLFVLALLSKPSVVILPGILMLLDQYKLHRMGKWDLDFLKKQLVGKLPWIIPSVIVGLAAIHFQQGGSQGDFMRDVGFWDRLLQIPTRLGYYLYYTFVPTRLSFHYAPPPYPAMILASGSALVLIALTIFSYRIRDRFPLALFALLWFYICILPMSGIVHVGSSFIADRYTYLAIIGIFACFAGAVIRYIPKHFGFPILGVVVLVSAWLARQQTMVWKDSYALFSHAIQEQPRDPIGYVNLGARYKLDGDLGRAGILYAKAIEIEPNDYIAHHNLAQIHLAKKEWEEGEKNLLEALEIYENYHPSMRALSELFRTVPEMRDLKKSLIFTQRYNKVVDERDAEMLGVEIELLLKLDRRNEAKSQARKLYQFSNLTGEAKMFIENLLHTDPSR